MPVRARRVVVSSAALLVGAGPAFAAGSPSQSSIIAAVRAQRSFHYVAVSTGNGVQLSIVGDAARDRGVQRITYRRGGVSGHATVLVAANTAYIRGDAFTLRHYMSFAAAAASK